MMGKKLVVGVQERDKVSARLVDAGVARRAAAAILLTDENDARVGEFLDHTRRIVFRAVVDDDNLEILIRLRQH